MVPGDQATRRGFPWQFDRLIATPRFQEILSRLPFGRYLSRRDGAAIFDVLQGFVASQVLAALVEFGVLRRLLGNPERAEILAHAAALPVERMEVLLRAGAALALLKKRRDGCYALARRGAAILGVPGLEAMIAHNRAFYADMADPVRLLRGGSPTQLAQFWPYVMGRDAPRDTAERYSDLMAQSQVLVAQDTLRMVDLAGTTRLMDIGGGSGAFLSAVLRLHPAIQAMLVDLPEVMPSAASALSKEGISGRVALCPQSFRDGPLPQGADTISLIRVLYDHDDATVADLIAKCHAALPAGGRLVVSEPMSGARRPDSATDVYFAFYTLAMGTGQVRSAKRIAALCKSAGFKETSTPHPLRSYITSVVTCVK